MNKLALSISTSVLWLLTTTCFADAAKPADQTPTVAQLQKTLQARLPKLHIESIQQSQWPFFYEVVSDGGELFYIDKTGDYLFLGKVMDTKTREDLTEKRWNALNQVDFKTLPFNLALKEVKGDGSRELVVFADPHCPFCTRFEKTLRDVDNVTVYTFLFPLEGLHPGATERAKRVWCAKDRLSAWHDWMLNQKDTPATACNTDDLNTLRDLGDKLKVTGTPTLIFLDGSRVPGAISKDDLEKQFKSLDKKS